MRTTANVLGLFRVAVVVLTLANSTSAETVRIAGAGAFTCKVWTSEVPYPLKYPLSTDAVADVQWAFGYASGIAKRGGPAVFNVIYSNNHEAFINAISQRCTTYPGARIDSTIDTILNEAPGS